MVHNAKRIGPLVLRLLVVLSLLGCPVIGSAAGTWSVLSLPRQSGEVLSPQAMAVDAAGNLYVADQGDSSIRRRDAEGIFADSPRRAVGITRGAVPRARTVTARHHRTEKRTRDGGLQDILRRFPHERAG